MVPRLIERGRRASRRSLTVDVLLVLALSIATLALWIPRWRGPLDLRWDGAVYYILGTSIAEGKGYRLLHEPGEITAIQYPPLLPLVAAAVQTVVGTTDPLVAGRALKILFFAFHASLIGLTYLMLRIFVHRWLASVGALAMLLSVQVTFHSNLFFAEIPFGVATVAFVLFNERGGTPLRRGLAAVCAVAAFLLRTAAVALFAAWVAEALAGKRFKVAALRLLTAAIPLVCWHAYVVHVERSPAYTRPAYPYQRAPYLNHNVSYATNLAVVDADTPGSGTASAGDVAWRVWRNFRGIGVTLGEAVSDSRGYWKYRLPARGQRFPVVLSLTRSLFYVPLLVLAAGIVGGMVVLIRRSEIFVPAYVCASVLLLCATPWPEQFRRYLVPVAPFLLASLFTGVEWLAARLRASARMPIRSCAPIIVGVVLVTIFDAEVNTLHSMYRYHLDPVTSRASSGELLQYRWFYYSAASKALDDGLDWLKTRANATDVVATSMPHWAYLRNGFKAVRPPLESDPQRTQMLLDSVPVSYIVLSPENDGTAINEYFRPFVEAHPHRWECIYVDEGRLVRIYQRVRRAA
jgi:hypothetical protein